MTIKNFTPEWKLWIWSNVVNGFDKESLFNILLNNGFDYNLVKNELEIEPANTLIWQRQYSQESLNVPYEVELYPFNKSLSDNGNVYRMESNFVEMYNVPEILTHEQCDELVKIADTHFKKLKPLTDKSKELQRELKLSLKPGSQFYSDVDSKINRLVGMDYSLGDNLYIEKFVPKFEHKEKYDFFMKNDKSIQSELDDKGQRVWSVKLFLNNLTEGGYVNFKSIEKEIKPIKGDAVIWKNLYNDGSENPYTKYSHSGDNNEPLYVLTKIYRERSGHDIVIETVEPMTIEVPTDNINE
jgi:prolyl 4-hydroxylase